MDVRRVRLASQRAHSVANHGAAAHAGWHGRVPDHGAGHPGGVRPGRRGAGHRLPDRGAHPRLAVPAGEQEHRAGRAVQPGRGAAGDHGRDSRGRRRLRAVGGRARRTGAVAVRAPGPRAVRHPALALHRAARRAGHHRARRVGGGHRDRRRGAPGDRLAGLFRRARAGADRGAVVGLLRRRGRREGRTGHGGGRPGGPPGARAGRVLLRLHPHAARDRRAGLRGQAGHREHREHAAGRALRGHGLRRRAVPGRQRGVPARAADRPWTLPADRRGRGAGRLLDRRDAERRRRDGRAHPDRRGRASGRAPGPPKGVPRGVWGDGQSPQEQGGLGGIVPPRQ